MKSTQNRRTPTPRTPTPIWRHKDWPDFRYDPAPVSIALFGARRVQGVAEGKLVAVGLAARLEAVAEAWARDAVATAEIEGERLNLEAVRSSIARRLGTAQRKGGRAPRQVEGLLDIMQDAVRNANDPLTDERLCGWQAALFPTGYSGIAKIAVGAYRSHAVPMQIVSGRVGGETVHYVAPPSATLAREMRKFLAWFNAPHDAGSIVHAAISHLWFETVHPFEDGNGRVGRAIIDLALARDAGEASRLFRFSQQLLDQRDEYYRRLETAQHGGLVVTEWVLWFVEQFSQACLRASAVVDLSLEKGHFWANHSGADLTERQRKVVNLLLDAGPRGFEGGMSTSKYQGAGNTSRATASRELVGLEAQGLLKATGTGRGTRYHIAIEGWEPV